MHVEFCQVGLVNAREVEQAGVLWGDVLGDGPRPLLVHLREVVSLALNPGVAHIFNWRLKCYFTVRIT